MNDEIKAAAERVRIYKAARLAGAHDDQMGRYESSQNLWRDMDLLADFVISLAAHRPDDGEPVTPEWTALIGGPVFNAGHNRVEVRFRSRENALINGRPFGEAVVEIRDTSDKLIVYPTSRGQLRSLLRGLGIEVKEAQ